MNRCGDLAARLTAGALLLLMAGCADSTAPRPASIAAERMEFDGPSTVFPGDSIAVRVSSAAWGNVAKWRVRIYLSQNLVISDEDAALADVVAAPADPNDYYSPATASASVRIPAGTAAGYYYLGAVVDPDQQFQDTIREDNSTRTSLRLGVGVVPSRVAQAPQLTGPADRVSTAAPSPQLNLTWTAVPAVQQYVVELDDCRAWSDTAAWWDSCRNWRIWTDQYRSTPDLMIGFPPNESGRWRVRGVDSSGMAGPASPWRTFRFY